MIPPFMFATGIENSYPTIDHGKHRVDEMEKCGHYEHWQHDFDCVQELGMRVPALRPAAAQDLARPDRYDWEFADLTFARPAAPRHRARSSTCATSACPTGSAISRTPTSRASSPSTRGAFAARFPWVQLYTPVNEMFICATLLGAATAGGTSS